MFGLISFCWRQLWPLLPCKLSPSLLSPSFLMAFRIFIAIFYIICILCHFLFQFIFEHYCLCTFGTAGASARIAQLTSPLNQKSASAARNWPLWWSYGKVWRYRSVYYSPSWVPGCLPQSARFRSSGIGNENKIWKVIPSIVWSRTKIKVRVSFLASTTSHVLLGK